MKLEQNYLTKLSSLAANLAQCNRGIGSMEAACDTIRFDDYAKMIRSENTDKFVQTWWKHRELDPDAKEMVSDLHNALAPFETRDQQTKALQVLSEAAFKEAVKLQCKAIEAMIPQGIGHAANEAVLQSIH